MMRIRRFIELQAPNPLYTSLRTAGIPAILYPGEIKDGRETTPSGMRGCSISISCRMAVRQRLDNRQARKRLHIITFPCQETNGWRVNCDRCKAGKRGRRSRNGEIRQNGKRECQESVASREARYASLREEGKRRSCDNSQASNSDWSVRSPRKGCQGSPQQAELRRLFTRQISRGVDPFWWKFIFDCAVNTSSGLHSPLFC